MVSSVRAPDPSAPDEASGFLARADLGRLLDLLHADGRTVIGPTLVDGAIVDAPIERVDDLPAGWTDEQSPGRYRLAPSGTERLFDYAVGPTSWKRFTFPPEVQVTVGHRADGRVTFEAVEPDPPRLAFLGVRALRDRRPARPGPGPDRRPGHGRRLRRAPCGHDRDRGRMRRPSEHVLLHLDGHRARGDGRLRPRPDRA